MQAEHLSTQITHETTARREAVWREAFHAWLGSRRAAATRRAYQEAWRDLLRFTPKPPWAIGQADIVHWLADLRARGLSEATVALRLAAVSSFYQFVSADYTILRPDGSEAALHYYNPAAARSIRPRINPYGKAAYLTTGQARALLAAIPRETVKGRRDLALFLGYLFTARRNSEWRTVQWGHFFQAGRAVLYRWSGKGKHDQRAELPPPVWLAIRNYLEAAGRWEKMRDEEYIFTSIKHRAARPLSMRETARSLKRYARQAGLDADKIKVHTLRHTAAMLRREAGDDIDAICRLLAHSSIAVTQIYLHAVEGTADQSWSKVEDLLGL